MEEILHSIKVNLYENYLTDNPNDYSVQTHSVVSPSLKNHKNSNIQFQSCVKS